MRQKLRERYNYYVYHLSVDDFDYMVAITDGLVSHRQLVLKEEERKIRLRDPENADDILDDYMYYNNLECYYLWESLVIRFIGIFEAIIKHKFLQDSRCTGCMSILRQLEKLGYTLQGKEEIREWANLRNELCHSPTEKYRPLCIDKNDISELKNLLTSEINNLEEQFVDR